jgi:hypothetical protein
MEVDRRRFRSAGYGAPLRTRIINWAAIVMATKAAG